MSEFNSASFDEIVERYQTLVGSVDKNSITPGTPGQSVESMDKMIKFFQFVVNSYNQVLVANKAAEYNELRDLAVKTGTPNTFSHIYVIDDNFSGSGFQNPGQALQLTDQKVDTLTAPFPQTHDDYLAKAQVSLKSINEFVELYIRMYTKYENASNSSFASSFTHIKKLFDDFATEHVTTPVTLAALRGFVTKLEAEDSVPPPPQAGGSKKKK